MNRLGNSVSMKYCLRRVCVRSLTNYKVEVNQFLYLSSDGVWAADNGWLSHRRMPNQGTFYIEWSNSITGKGNIRLEFTQRRAAGSLPNIDDQLTLTYAQAKKKITQRIKWYHPILQQTRNIHPHPHSLCPPWCNNCLLESKLFLSDYPVKQIAFFYYCEYDSSVQWLNVPGERETWFLWEALEWRGPSMWWGWNPSTEPARYKR